MFENANIKTIDLLELSIKQLQISRNFLDQRDDIHSRISLILIDNTVEILLKERIPYDISIKDFKDMVNKVKIDLYQKFVILFMHQTRNVLYHRGFPHGIEYALKVPNLFNKLTKIYFNLTCDLVINFNSSPFYKDSFQEIYKVIHEFKFYASSGNEFDIEVNAFLKFFATKWSILNEMVEYIMKVSSTPHPDIHFKWSEFWRKGYQFKNDERFKEDFKKYNPKFRYEKLINIGEKLIKSFQISQNKTSMKDKHKISSLLIEINSLLRKYEDIIFVDFAEAENVIDARRIERREEELEGSANEWESSPNK